MGTNYDPVGNEGNVNAPDNSALKGWIAYILGCGVIFGIAYGSPMAIAKSHRTAWADSLNGFEVFVIALAPAVLMLLMAVLFRFIWVVEAPKKDKDPEKGSQEERTPVTTEMQNYGGTNESSGAGVSDVLAHGDADYQAKKKADAEAFEKESGGKSTLKSFEAGAEAGNYDAAWTSTFDLTFLIIMVVLLGVLLVLTQVLQPKLWGCAGGTFWPIMLLLVAAQSAVGVLGGTLARHFVEIDDKGYSKTTAKSLFKVNYTRKLQHLAAYVIPLAITPPMECTAEYLYPDRDYQTLGLIQAWWAHWFTLLGFLALIKPVRESLSIFMIQFNSMDRPEDRPNCLSWLVGGNIMPGYCMLIPLRYLFGLTCQESLIYVVIFIVGLGDGFAEPVGVNMGLHKYKARACDCLSPEERDEDGKIVVRTYSRSWEGSACVFLSGIFFPCCQYALFANATQFALACVILPPCVMVAEATAPHTLDTVSLILVASGILLALFHMFPDGALSPHSAHSCAR